MVNGAKSDGVIVAIDHGHRRRKSSTDWQGDDDGFLRKREKDPYLGTGTSRRYLGSILQNQSLVTRSQA